MVASTIVQDDVNRRVYHAQHVTREYQSQSFNPAEVMVFMRHRDAFVGRDVLDVGVGTGRTTRCLAPLARRYVALDYSPVMVEYTKAVFPAVDVVQADIRDLSTFAAASFDTVFASNNVLDALSHPDRLRALAEVRRVLRLGGTFGFSSHNRRYAQALNGPRLEWSRSPLRTAWRAVRLIRQLRNHWRIRHLRRVEADYALLNDIGHDFACLHYYIDDATQARQLRTAGFSLVEVLNNQGRVFAAGSCDTSGDSWLMYIVRTE